MKPLVSVVVPVYNSERYIAKCVDSIINQTYRNLEIILIDDGSTDTSGKICDEYAEKDKRVRVIHKKNSGVSEARNCGIREAAGRYISFLDSDDYFEIETIEISSSVIEAEKADAVIWGYYADFLDAEGKVLFSKIISPNTGNLSKKDNSRLSVDEQFWGIGYVWNKLYRMDIIKENDFWFNKDISMGEDTLFNASVLSEAGKITILETPYTHYIQRPEKTLGTTFHHNIFDLKMMWCEAKRNFLVKWGFNNDKIESFYNKSAFNGLKSSLKSVINTDELTDKEKGKYIDKILKDPRTLNMLASFKPANMKESVFLFILKHKILRGALYRYFKK